MNKTQAGRLLTLAYYLKTEVPTVHFRMDAYFEIGDPRRSEQDNLEQHVCGTTACALGWATVVFPKYWGWQDYLPIYKPEPSLYRIEACEDFFGIGEDGRGWTHIFGAINRRTPQQEAKVIEEYVREKGWVYA